VDFLFHMTPDAGPYPQGSSIYFNWESDYVAPARLIALEVGGKIWEIFTTDVQGITSFRWDKVNITAGGSGLVTFPDSGQFGTGGRCVAVEPSAMHMSATSMLTRFVQF
jgi:hypothetical protein